MGIISTMKPTNCIRAVKSYPLTSYKLSREVRFVNFTHRACDIAYNLPTQDRRTEPDRETLNTRGNLVHDPLLTERFDIRPELC